MECRLLISVRLYVCTTTTYLSKIGLIQLSVVVDVSCLLLESPMDPVVEARDIALLRLPEEHVLKTGRSDNVGWCSVTIVALKPQLVDLGAEFLLGAGEDALKFERKCHKDKSNWRE